MSAYETFAIWGAGNLGSRIAFKLLELRPNTLKEVIILTRLESKDSSSNQELAKAGAQIRVFDVMSPDAHRRLRDIDVLMATLSFGGLPLQQELVRVAFKAGIKLFVPAEWGDTTDGRPEPIFQLKQKVRADAGALGLPTATFFTGMWTEQWLEYIGFDKTKRRMVIRGVGDALISTTSIDDIARFAVHVLTTLPRQQLEYSKFTLQGDVITSNAVAASLQLLVPDVLSVSHTSRNRLQKKLARDPDDIMASIFLGWDHGRGRHPGELSHHVWPAWKPRKALDVIKPLVQARQNHRV